MRTAIAVVGLFALGFLTHAFVFPDFLSRTIDFNSAKQKILGEKQANQETSKSLTIATFKNGSFHPSKIWMGKGYYVGIKNEDEKSLMWLSSNEPSLNTVRGFGFGEQLTAIMPTAGTYKVYEKNTKSALVIVVQP